MNQIPKAFLIVLMVALSSCASNRTKTLMGMGILGVAGGAIGAVTSPKNEAPSGHALLWGGIGAAVAGAIGLFIFDEEKRSDEIARQNDVLKKSLEALNDSGLGGGSHLLYETSAPFGKEVPPEYRSLIRPGRWSVYGLNQWTVQGENTLIHQDKMMKLLPPEFNPNIQTEEESK